LGIQSKILSAVGAMILCVILLATLLNSLRVQTLSKDLSLKVAEETSQRNGLEVKSLLTSALEDAKLLEASFWQLRNAKVERAVLDQILRENTRMDRNTLGSWMLWEENAYDGKDDDYKGKTGHDDTGRVNSYLHWAGDDIVHEVNVDWETSSWYQNPKKRLKETLVDPYFYTVSGERLLLISSIQPIVHDNKFYGVVGVDLKLETIQELVGSLKVLDSGYSTLIANDGTYVAHPDKSRIGKNINEYGNEYNYLMSRNDSDSVKIEIGYDDALQTSVYHMSVKIHVGKTDSFWTLMIAIPEKEIVGPAIEIRNEIFLIGLISGLIMLLFLTLLVRKLLAPVLDMTRILNAKFNSELGKFPQFDIDSQDEFGELAAAFNQMSLEINQSRTQLEQLNTDLSFFNEQLEQRVLRDTKKLLESEKMASLGRLVNGISHEINTPVGVCITAVSFLQDLISEKSDATASEIQDSLNFLSENINKVSSLINSFKLLAVSSSVGDKVLFSCRDLVMGAAKSIRSQFDARHVEINIEGEDVRINSFPSDLSQVINHIVSNSIIHGFKSKDGVLDNRICTIALESTADDVTIVCADNGIGMSEEMTEKIFEAFSTSDLGAEGKGLGMNIVYNIITQTLKGSIECESRLNEGTLYRIRFPRS